MTYLDWIKAHERMIIIGLVLLVSAWGYNKWTVLTANRDTETTKAAILALQEQKAVNQTTAQQIAQLAQQNAQDKAFYEQQLTQLTALIASRDAAARASVSKVTQPNETAQQAVNDLSSTYALPVPVTVTATGADVPTVDLQQMTATKIEADTAKADLADTRTELQASQKEITNAEGMVTDRQNQVTGLQLEISKANAACQDEIKTKTATLRKNRKWYFVAGAIAFEIFRGMVLRRP